MRRTNLVLDDQLLEQATRVLGAKTYSAAVNTALAEVIRATQPHVATIEKVFVNVNPQSTLLLGQERGAAICAAVNEGLVVHEYAALRKQKNAADDAGAEHL